MNNLTQIEIYEQAILYIQKGYSIIPVGPDKRPLIQWKPYQTTPATEKQFTSWFKQFPNMNIAIVTGKVSNLTVVDFDTKSGKINELLQKFPPTYMVKTPSGGAHLYYKYQEGFTVSANAYPDLPYVDIRGDTGYVVASPSQTSVGEYKVIQNMEIQPFPTHLFPKQKAKRTLASTVGVKSGERNSSLASVIGKLLLSEPDEDKWLTDVLPAIQQINKTYTPVLSDQEVLTVFNSIVKKERNRKDNLPTSIDGEVMDIKKSRSGLPFMNMANVVAILEAHPDFRKKIRYNTFRQEIEINGIPIEDNDIIKIQYTLQTKFGLHSITKDAVFSALVHCAYDNKYDEARDWLTGLIWDAKPRLFTWLTMATGVEDNTYTRGVGTQWFLQIANRIMHPGCLADYMLVLVGKQGVGKTSLFRILGGKWYKSFTGSVENKDFYLTLRGALIIDLDEGSTLYKADVIKIKSIVSAVEDEFRAPYDRVPKKFPRRFVFSMSTNDVEPFRDVTGNRRYWAIDFDKMVNFKWLEDNREQLFAEALYWLEHPSDEIPQVGEEEAKEMQEQHMADDAWTELVVTEVRKSYEYCSGDANYSTTILEVFQNIFKNETAIRLDRKYELRIGNIFRKELGLERRREMIEGERKNRWYIVGDIAQRLQQANLKVVTEPIDEF